MWDFVNKSKYKMCISIVQKANKNSIKFSLSTQTRRVIKSSQTKSLQMRRAQEEMHSLEGEDHIGEEGGK